eukprot:TRINITY_DN39189_c0_g1_i5.p1 TRINITY_DN39189_c0_g1~~TRINITY_DN39189_c0_g1_i5.p1  ORF type:complete len:1170 (+),score=420.06 TRINITY_DN39189_c0_g1_i5:206-3715(+)
MEISLHETRNLPKGSLLSIRAGTTRRQAQAETGKFKLSFPKGNNPSEPLRIDLLATLGSAAIDISAGLDSYDVCFPQGNNNYAVKLGVHGAVPTDPKMSSGPLDLLGAPAVDSPKGGKSGDPGRRHVAALNARKYLDDHKLLNWAQILFHDLIRDEPTDPWAYIEEHLDCGRRSGKGTKAVALRNRISKTTKAAADICMELEAGGVSQAETSALAAKVEALSMELEAAMLRKEKFEGDVVKSAVHAKLSQASASGQLAAALKKAIPQVKSENVVVSMKVSNVDYPSLLRNPSMLADFKAKTKEAIAEAAGPGVKPHDVSLQLSSGSVAVKATITPPAGVSAKRLGQSMSSGAGGLAAGVVAKVKTVSGIESVVSGEIACTPPETSIASAMVPSGEEGRVRTMQNKVGEALADAAASGRLAEALESLHGGDVADIAPPDLQEAARMQAAHSLMGVDAAGLAKALHKAKTLEGEQLEDLRKKAAGELTLASEDGRLSQAVSAKKVNENEELRQTVADGLIRSTSHGLAQAIAKATDEGSTEELRLQTAETLLNACRDGRLAQALGQAKEDDFDVDKLRAQASQTLLAASQDGRLAEALQGSKKEEAQDVNALREMASRTLLEASQDGRLAEALSGAKPGQADVDVDALREMASSTLLKASQDGRLAEVLAQTKHESEEDSVDELRAMASQTLLAASADGRLMQALAASKPKDDEEESIDALRQLASSTLLGACQDGRLAKALSDSKATDDNSSVDELRKLASNTLLQASMDGRLAKALSEQKGSGEETEALRAKVAGTLQSAVTDNMLNQAVSKTSKASGSTEQLRQRMSSVLLNAAKDGSLEKAISSRASGGGSSNEVDDLRKLASETLLSASQDGRLQQALEASKASPPGEDVEDLRALASQTLLQASQDGRLADALAAANKGGSAEEDEVDNLRQLASETLLKACQDGSLANALSQASAEKGGADEVDSLRKKASETLLAASADGSLAAALAANSASKAGPPPPPPPAPPAGKPEEDMPEETSAKSAPPMKSPEMETCRKEVCSVLLEASEDGRLAEALQKHMETKPAAAPAASAASATASPSAPSAAAVDEATKAHRKKLVGKIAAAVVAGRGQLRGSQPAGGSATAGGDLHAGSAAGGDAADASRRRFLIEGILRMATAGSRVDDA